MSSSDRFPLKPRGKDIFLSKWTKHSSAVEELRLLPAPEIFEMPLQAAVQGLPQHRQLRRHVFAPLPRRLARRGLGLLWNLGPRKKHVETRA